MLACAEVDHQMMLIITIDILITIIIIIIIIIDISSFSDNLQQGRPCDPGSLKRNLTTGELLEPGKVEIFIIVFYLSVFLISCFIFFHEGKSFQIHGTWQRMNCLCLKITMLSNQSCAATMWLSFSICVPFIQNLLLLKLCGNKLTYVFFVSFVFLCRWFYLHVIENEKKQSTLSKTK